jgi:hypothetical protein
MQRELPTICANSDFCCKNNILQKYDKFITGTKRSLIAGGRGAILLQRGIAEFLL